MTPSKASQRMVPVEVTAPTTPTRITAIEERLASATPGPWELGEVTPMPDGWPGFYADVEPNIGGGLDPHDAELIAHAPADLAALLAFAKAVKAFTYRSPNGYDTAYDEIRDLINDLEHP